MSVINCQLAKRLVVRVQGHCNAIDHELANEWAKSTSAVPQPVQPFNTIVRHGIISMDCCSPIQRQQLEMANIGSERGRHGIISMDCCSPIHRQQLKMANTGSRKRATWDHLNGLLQPIQRQQLKMANTGSRKRATWDHLNGLLQPHPASTAEDGQYWLPKEGDMGSSQWIAAAPSSVNS